MAKHELETVINHPTRVTNWGQTNQINLQKRVMSVHRKRIRELQKEVVKMSLLNQQKSQIKPILKEINKLRELLSITGAASKI